VEAAADPLDPPDGRSTASSLVLAGRTVHVPFDASALGDYTPPPRVAHVSSARQERQRHSGR
jgi:hypothetical protein